MISGIESIRCRVVTRTTVFACIVALLSGLTGCGVGSVRTGHTTASGPYMALAHEVFTETNLLRTRPANYAGYLEEIAHRMQGKVYYPAGSSTGIVTIEGGIAVREGIAALQGQKPLPALRWSEALAELARAHVADTGARGLTGHHSSTGKGFAARVSQVAEQEGFAAVSENLSYGYDNARDVVAQLVIDDGVPGRGHRRNLLAAQINYIGVACGQHREYRSMCAAIYAYRK